MIVSRSSLISGQLINCPYSDSEFLMLEQSFCVAYFVRARSHIAFSIKARSLDLENWNS